MHRPQTKRCQQALEMVADTVDSVNDLKSVIEKQSLNQDNMNTDSEGKAVRELDVVSFIRVPHHQQMRDWDCGVSCVLMICRYFGFVVTYMELLHRLGDNKSIWTIDLFLLLRKHCVLPFPASFSTLTFGVDPKYVAQPFYAADLPDDEVRVARLFKRAVREYKESVQQRSLSDGEFEQLVYKKCLMLVLVDRQHLPCYDCNFDDDDDSNDDDSNDQENANNYVGHFIVITGITRSGMFLYSDPNKSVSVCRCHAVDMHKARKAVGTDEDVIVIPTA